MKMKKGSSEKKISLMAVERAELNSGGVGSNSRVESASLSTLGPFGLSGAQPFIYGMGRFLHESSLEGSGEHGRRIIGRIVTYVSLRRFRFERRV